MIGPLSLESPAVTHWEISTALIVGGGLLVCLASAIAIAAAYASGYRRLRSKVGDLSTALLEEQQKCKEMQHESDYWRGLVRWKEEHADRDPVQEECDEIWERIIAQKPQFIAAPAVVVTPMGELATYSTLDDLTRAKP